MQEACTRATASTSFRPEKTSALGKRGGRLATSARVHLQHLGPAMAWTCWCMNRWSNAAWATRSRAPSTQWSFLVLLGDNLLMTRHQPGRLAPSTACATCRPTRDGAASGRFDARPRGPRLRYGRHARRSHHGDRGEARSRDALDLALCGRYLWTEDAAALLDRYDVEAHGGAKHPCPRALDERGRHDRRGARRGRMVQWKRPLPLKAQIDHPCGARTCGETSRRG